MADNDGIRRIRIGENLYAVDADGDGEIWPEFEEVYQDGKIERYPERHGRGVESGADRDHFVRLVDGKWERLVRLHQRCYLYLDRCPLEDTLNHVVGDVEDVYLKVLLHSGSAEAKREAAIALGIGSADEANVQAWLLSKGFRGPNDVSVYAEYLSRCSPAFALPKLIQLSRMDVKGDARFEDDDFYVIAMKAVMRLADLNRGNAKAQLEIFKTMAGVEYDGEGRPFIHLRGRIQDVEFMGRRIETGEDVDLHVAGRIATGIGLYTDDPSIMPEIAKIAASRECNVCVRCYALRMLSLMGHRLQVPNSSAIEEMVRSLADDPAADEIVRDCARDSL